MQKEREKIKKYSIIYADPPWRYLAKKVQGAAENHYPTMSIEELCALPVVDLAVPDSALFLWATFPQLPGGSIQKPWNMRTSITLWHPPRIRLPYSADGAHSSTTLTARCRSSFPLSTAVPIPAAAIKSISRKRMTTITASGTSLPGC